jgi:GTP cyclohydrolase II
MGTMNVEACTTDIRQVASSKLPTRWGSFRILGFEREVSSEHGSRLETAVALIMGDLSAAPPLLRIHSQCFTGDTLGSVRCDCRAQLELAMKAISREGAGILIYEMQEGRGIGLMAKLQAYALQDEGLDTVEANQHLGLAVDSRDYRLPVEILKELGIGKVRLLSNNPDKYAALIDADIEVVERLPCEVPPDPHANSYLLTKKIKLGHLLALV